MSVKQVGPASFSSISRMTRRPDREVRNDWRRHGRVCVRAGARGMKAFNWIVTAGFTEGPIKNGGRRVTFGSGDHPEPTEFVKSVIEGFGFVAIYLGGLATGGRLQQAGAPLAGRDLVDFGSL